MGQRGPAPKGEYENKSQVLSTRIRADTRKSLTDAATKSGRSLSQEIEHRLRRTFIEDDRMEDAFGNRRNYLLMRLIALALEGSRNLDNPDANWLDDPVCFDLAARCVTKILETLRPTAPLPPATDKNAEAIREILPAHNAAVLWYGIMNANPGLSLAEGTRADHLMGIMKAELGQVVERTRTVSGNKSDPGERSERRPQSEDEAAPASATKRQSSIRKKDEKK
jgi:hypothetical protein